MEIRDAAAADAAGIAAIYNDAVERSTAIIDANGTVSSIGRKIQPAKHVGWLAGELGI